MEDNDNNLERFFNKKYAQDMDAEPWNSPPDDIWTGIETDIKNRNGRRKRLGILLPLLICGLGICSAGYFYWQIKSYKSKVRELEIQLKACGADSERAYSMNNPVMPVNPPTIPVAPVPNHVVHEPIKAINGTGQLPDTKTLIAQQVGTTVPTTKNDAIAIADTIKLPATDTNTGTGFNNNKPLGFGPSISILLGPKIQTVQRPQTFILYFDKTTKLKKHNRLWQVGAATEVMFWRDRIKGELDAPLSELLKNETVSNTLAYGVVAKKGISRHWALDAGLFYGARENTSDYLLKVPYTLATEHSNPDGSLGNEFAHSLPSGLGNVNTFLVLNRSASSTVADKEEIKLDFAFQQRALSLFVPLKLTYYPTQVGKGLYAGVGINHEIGLKNELAVVAAKSLHDKVHEKSIAISLGNNRQRNYNLQAVMNIGYQLPISGRLSGVLDFGYNRALIDRFSTKGYRHKIDNWALGLSVNRSF